MDLCLHLAFVPQLLGCQLISLPAPLWLSTAIAIVATPGAALLFLLSVIADLVAFGSRTPSATPCFKKVKSETAKAHLMKALPSKAGMQEALSSRRGGVAEVL